MDWFPKKRACLAFFLCQLTALSVLCCVSLTYFTVALYLPSYQTSGSLENSEMMNIRLEGCDPGKFHTNYCHKLVSNLKDFQCINGECASLNGLFNCSKGPPSDSGENTGASCKNLTSVLSCNVTTIGPQVICNTRKACLHFDGLYDCDYGACAQIRSPFFCKKHCVETETRDNGLMVRHGDDGIITAKCARAIDTNMEMEIWSKILAELSMSCRSLMEHPSDRTTFFLADCFFGTCPEPDDHFIIQHHHEAEDRTSYAGRKLDKNLRNKCTNSKGNGDMILIGFGRLRIVMIIMTFAAVAGALTIVSCSTLIIYRRKFMLGSVHCSGANSKAVFDMEADEDLGL